MLTLVFTELSIKYINLFSPEKNDLEVLRDTGKEEYQHSSVLRI